MRVVSDAFRIVSRPGAEPGEESPYSAEEQRAMGGDDPSGLVDLLKNIDGLKNEIHDRIQRFEAVRQARAVLMDDAARTDVLNRRLAGLGLGTVASHSGFPAADNELHNLELLRQRSTPTLTPIDYRNDPANASAAPWRRSEELGSQLEHAGTAQMPHNAAQSRSLLEESPISKEERSAIAQGIQRLEQVEQMCKQYEQATLEAKRLLEETKLQLSSAASKEQQAAADLQSAQEALAASQQSADHRIEEAERCWKLVDDAAKAVKDRVELASAELVESRARQEASSADLLTARQDLTTAYQFAAVAAQRRLESREYFEKASRWMIMALALSWALMAWLAWLSFRQFVPIWAPGVVSALILLTATRVRTKEKEES